jgi:hypothetical protein
MERRFTQIFLVIVMSLFISMSSTYFHYYSLAETDVLSLDLSIGNLGQGNLLVDQHTESKVFISRIFSIIFLMETSLFEQFSNFFSQAPCFDQKNLIFRC